jgi:SAM-dependent methyltransferase
MSAVIARDSRTASLDSVSGAYDTWASAYIERFASADCASEEDRALIRAWGGAISGPVLDAGCGPGHWSAFLRALGPEVEGVDATPTFVAHARATHPELPFRIGDLRDLRLAEDSLGGVLAWFSLIHADPTEVPGVLRDLGLALRPGGSLLLGFFTGPELEPFDHTVVTAWAWPLPWIVGAVETAGLRVVTRTEYRSPNGRALASLVAGLPA